MPAAPAYRVRDLWAHTTRETAGTLTATVPAHGTVMLRVARDPRWAVYPPAVDAGTDVPVAYPGARPFVEPGTSVTVTTTATNSGKLPAVLLRNNLAVPDGWNVMATSRKSSAARSARTRGSPRPGRSQLPADAKPGSYDLSTTATYGRTARSAEHGQVDVLNASAPPSGTSYLSDIPWLRADNGYGPVEKDTSNGEKAAGDGHPITIDGSVYKKGLGTNAPSAIEYYTAEKCTSLSTDVGVDDEKDGERLGDLRDVGRREQGRRQRPAAPPPTRPST